VPWRFWWCFFVWFCLVGSFLFVTRGTIGYCHSTISGNCYSTIITM
jgi:hypothetical protein